MGGYGYTDMILYKIYPMINRLTGEPIEAHRDRVCPNLNKPTRVKDRQEFLRVGRGHYVFSAFLDTRIDAVRIMGIVSGEQRNLTYCQLWYEHKDHVTISNLTVALNRERRWLA